MRIIQCRRDFLAGLSVAGAAGILGAQRPRPEEGPPETTAIRIQREELENPICLAPEFVAEDLLRAEGFTDVEYCFELFVHEPVRTVTDLKGRRVGVPDVRGGPAQLYV